MIEGDLVSLAEALIEKENYEGIYQVASFHPKYCFKDSEENDAANYTNRSVYPMLHILRETSMEKALEYYDEPAVAAIIRRVEDNGYHFSEAIIGIVDSVPFQQRQREHPTLPQSEPAR